MVVGSGGAYLHSGVLVGLARSTFAGNRAGGGLAVSSLGMMESIVNTSFESNAFYCPSGEYGHDVGEFEDKVTKLQH